jgi:thiazole biosynthesis enzyme
VLINNVNQHRLCNVSDFMTKFEHIDEKQVTRAIVNGFTRDFNTIIESDVAIVGGGPSGLVAAKELASAGKNVVIFEANNYLGGGFWIGGYLMNKLTVRAPGQIVLDEIGVPYEEVEPGLFMADGPHACSKLVAAACDAGAKIINMTKVDDVVMREGRVAGVVINWTPVGALPRAITCVDPVAVESKLVIDATGHDAIVVNSLVERGMVDVKGFGGMWVSRSEDALVEHTGEVYPGLLATGMAVATVHGLPRMGPTFGGMLISGKRVAEIAIQILESDILDIQPLTTVR